MNKLTLEEKKLEALKKQLFGKQDQTTKANISSSSQTITISSDHYLRQDLIKVFIFTAIALGVQLSLFFISKNNVFKIPLI